MSFYVQEILINLRAASLSATTLEALFKISMTININMLKKQLLLSEDVIYHVTCSSNSFLK